MEEKESRKKKSSSQLVTYAALHKSTKTFKEEVLLCGRSREK